MYSVFACSFVVSSFDQEWAYTAAKLHLGTGQHEAFSSNLSEGAETDEYSMKWSCFELACCQGHVPVGEA